MLDHWPGPLRRTLFKLVGVNWAEQLLNDAWQTGNGDLHGMLDSLLRRNNFSLSADNTELLDGLGSCIVAGNHPHGLFDGLGLAWLASQSRVPTRIMARNFLNIFGPLRKVFLSVNLDKERRSVGGSKTLTAASQWLREEGRLVITPAGGLSQARPFWKNATDPAWRTGIVRLARETDRPIVLVDVQMPRAPMRQLLHRIHPVLRAVVQVWAYRLGKHQTIHMRVVEVIAVSDLPADCSLPDQALWLQNRLATGQLGHQTMPKPSRGGRRDQ
ncbi:1-acyl-sn-glycerol-3-phosphate acyltransferase [Saccharospirillum impatiens]|uniref:1-acyl-sn-glycerol-3-phosphate acyltransferase n=1 Tax=Saccharospirillum impatiens TaxID=169438 RepID=UPI0004110B50|nr:1-acyl-sn-glycerol-3-phosphate acyltransferase [Saccharospirillum impatiens]